MAKKILRLQGEIIFGSPSYPQRHFRVFCPFCPLFGAFISAGGGGGCAFICLCIRTRVEYPGQEGWNHPFPRSKKMVISFTQLKLFCLTSTQTGNLKMACQHPSCSVSIQKGAVNKHSDWRWKIWRARRALSKFREHNATSFFAYDSTACWGIPRRYRKS